MGKIPVKRRGKRTDKDELVLTPGGWRPKSKVHHVPPGYHIDGAGGRLKIIETATGKVIEDLGEIPEEKPVKARKPRSGSGSGRKKTEQAKKEH